MLRLMFATGFLSVGMKLLNKVPKTTLAHMQLGAADTMLHKACQRMFDDLKNGKVHEQKGRLPG